VARITAKSTSASISNSALDTNGAVSGMEGAEGAGSNGFGGGVYVGARTTASPCGAAVQSNAAADGSGASLDHGQGGGLHIQSGATAFLDPYMVADTLNNTVDVDPNTDGSYILQSC
jgi:hypothetical protein